MKAFAALTVLAMLMAPSAMAQAPAKSGNAQIDGFVSDIGAKHKTAAVARIASMESLSGRPNLVARADQMVDRLLGCTLVSLKRSGIATIYDLRWKCAHDNYVVLLETSFHAPRLTVAQFMSDAEWTRTQNMGPRMAPQPKNSN